MLTAIFNIYISLSLYIYMCRIGRPHRSKLLTVSILTRCGGIRTDPILSFRVTEALASDQLKHGGAEGQLAPAVIVLPDRTPGQKRQQSIMEFMVPSRSVRHCA
jgi:hypothetical protein